MLNIDIWHGRSMPTEYTVDCFFNGRSGTYSGNIYNKDERAVGDYWGDDSTEIARKFGIDFGN